MQRFLEDRRDVVDEIDLCGDAGQRQGKASDALEMEQDYCTHNGH